MAESETLLTKAHDARFAILTAQKVTNDQWRNDITENDPMDLCVNSNWIWTDDNQI